MLRPYTGVHPTMRLIRSTAPRRQRARGFALIEALIAILIFSLGALGLLGLQVSMMKATSGAKFRADAAYLANDLVGTMWTDAANLAAYRDSCAGHAPCRNWVAKVEQALPGGTHELSICVQATDCAGGAADVGRVTLNVEWTVPNEGVHSFKTSTSINP